MTAGPLPLWPEASAPWPREARRPSTAASWPGSSSSSCTAGGAPFEADDFARQQAVDETPIATDYRGVTVYETTPPSQGFLYA